MTDMKNIEQIDEAEMLLQCVRHNLVYRPASTTEYNKRDVARVKEIVDELYLVLNGEKEDADNAQ